MGARLSCSSAGGRGTVDRKGTPGSTAAADRAVDLRGMTVAAMGTQQRHSIQTSSVTSRQRSLSPFDDTTLRVLPCLQDRRVMPVHSIIHAQAACFGRL